MDLIRVSNTEKLEAGGSFDDSCRRNSQWRLEAALASGVRAVATQGGASRTAAGPLRFASWCFAKAASTRDGGGMCANIRPADLTGLRDLSGLFVETAAPQGGVPRTADFDDSCRRNNRWRLDAASVSGATPTEKQFVFSAKICQNAQIN